LTSASCIFWILVTMTIKEIDTNDENKKLHKLVRISETSVSLTTPNEPDAESTGQVRNTSDKIAASNELARSFPLLLILRVPSMQFHLGELPSLRRQVNVTS